jgi:hypothetical protein
MGEIGMRHLSGDATQMHRLAEGIFLGFTDEQLVLRMGYTLAVIRKYRRDSRIVSMVRELELDLYLKQLSKKRTSDEILELTQGVHRHLVSEMVSHPESSDVKEKVSVIKLGYDSHPGGEFTKRNRLEVAHNHRFVGGVEMLKLLGGESEVLEAEIVSEPEGAVEL